MAYYNNVSTSSEKELSSSIEDFFAEWALRNNFSLQINALMRNYDYCVKRNNKRSSLKLYNLMIIKQEASSPPSENFISVVTGTTKELFDKLENFMKEWGKANGYTTQIETLIADYKKCSEANYKKAQEEEEKESARSLLERLRFLTRLQIGDDDIKWLCIPQKCKTEEDKLVCLEENGWKPISLDEVSLIITGPKGLISSVITDEAKEQGVELPENDEDITFVFTERSRYPYLIDGGLLFCRKWVSSNAVAARKIVLSETPGDTRVIVGEGDESVILGKIIAVYKVLGDDKAELYLYDETGAKQVLNFNVEHNKHPDHEARELPDANTLINYCAVKFVYGLVKSQMSHNPENEATSIVIKNEEGKHRLVLCPRYFDYKDGKIYLEDKEMFVTCLSPENAVGTFKNT
ncbi:Hypothetical protein HVR_LOCUS332 [uncultured virus]|nr:Hypothetical protein HVR_LOCUS332 [uncultured virus]